MEKNWKKMEKKLEKKLEKNLWILLIFIFFIAVPHTTNIDRHIAEA